MNKYPVAILISGSGQQDRDETIFGHKPFLVIADYLTRQGIAILRIDDKGVGQRTEKETLADATSYDFALDVIAGIEYLKTRKDINPNQISLIGRDANKTKIWSLKDMDTDHVTAWRKGRATDIKNCEMLCKTHNRAKGNR